MRAPLAAALATALLATPLHAEEKRELGSHEHGHVTLQLAVEGNDVSVALEAPGKNIVGFEHAATTDEQKASVEAAIEQLSDAGALFVMPEAAGCTAASADAELHMEGEHAAFEATYKFNCANVAALTSLETKLFALYPSIEEIEVEYATPAGQGSGELEADAPVLSLPSTS